MLCEADESIVNRAVAVWVVVLQNFPNHAGTFVEGTVMEKAFAQHGVENTPLHGLEPVAGVGQGAANDNRHRIVDVSRLHDLGDVGNFRVCMLGIVWCEFFGHGILKRCFKELKIRN